ncbi:hypothetical protein SY83_17860 [Paenibacillus swuensis]|uniref:Uncharacterized protein n=2 Tax=Paenibacillus swuensis TaxID=1178515 RepID=A0A172TLD5_9BACL|nr:hypothetical protein SY83_17860 [Paenibacillus swuensis]
MWRGSKGSIALEAAVTMPFFLAFVIALTSMIQMSITQLALHTATSETTKIIAAHMYPVELLVEGAKATGAGQTIMQTVDHVKSAREAVLQAESLFGDFSFLVPDAILDLAVWAERFKSKIQTQAQEGIEDALIASFQPLFRSFANQSLPQTTQLRKEQLRIVKITFPIPGNREYADFGIVAEYTFKLNIPFFHKQITLRDQAYERVWVGE